jgi:hypothetical protein
LNCCGLCGSAYTRPLCPLNTRNSLAPATHQHSTAQHITSHHHPIASHHHRAKSLPTFRRGFEESGRFDLHKAVLRGEVIAGPQHQVMAQPQCALQIAFAQFDVPIAQTNSIHSFIHSHACGRMHTYPNTQQNTTHHRLSSHQNREREKLSCNTSIYLHTECLRALHLPSTTQ